MALEDRKRFSVPGVPNTRSLIERRCNDAVSSGTESAVSDGTFMAKDGDFLIPGQSAEQSGFGLGHIGPFGRLPVLGEGLQGQKDRKWLSPADDSCIEIDERDRDWLRSARSLAAIASRAFWSARSA